MTDETTNEPTLEEVVEPVDERTDVERERDDYRDALQRLQADFENYRKRVVRDADDAATRAAGSLITTMLPVLDAFDLADAHFKDVENDSSAALRQTRSLLIDTLAKQGLERLDAVGVGFDPQVHEAVAHEPGDESGDQVVSQVLRAGYLWKGAVLRPAMVTVRG